MQFPFLFASLNIFDNFGTEPILITIIYEYGNFKCLSGVNTFVKAAKASD